MSDQSAHGTIDGITHDFIPLLRNDNAIIRHGQEIVAWSAIRPAPVYLDPVAAVLYDVVDGKVSVGGLIEDASVALDIDSSVAEAQVRRATQLFRDGGLLTASIAEESGPVRGALFHAHDN